MWRILATRCVSFCNLGISKEKSRAGVCFQLGQRLQGEVNYLLSVFTVEAKAGIAMELEKFLLKASGALLFLRASRRGERVFSWPSLIFSSARISADRGGNSRLSKK